MRSAGGLKCIHFATSPRHPVPQRSWAVRKYGSRNREGNLLRSAVWVSRTQENPLPHSVFARSDHHSADADPSTHLLSKGDWAVGQLPTVSQSRIVAPRSFCTADWYLHTRSCLNPHHLPSLDAPFLHLFPPLPFLTIFIYTSYLPVPRHLHFHLVLRSCTLSLASCRIITRRTSLSHIPP